MLMTITGREKVSSLVASTGLTASNIPQGGLPVAVVQAIGGDVRFTVNGTTPVAATTGQKLLDGNFVELTGKELDDFLAIDDGGTAVLEVVFGLKR